MQGLKQFLSGIYGSDALNQVLMILGMILLAVASFFHGPILIGLAFLPIAIAMFRTLSHEHARRNVENRAFLKFWRPIERRLVLFYTFVIDRGRFQYQPCPHCQQLLRLPKTKQNLNVTCPKCKTKFQIKPPKSKE